MSCLVSGRGIRNYMAAVKFSALKIRRCIRSAWDSNPLASAWRRIDCSCVYRRDMVVFLSLTFLLGLGHYYATKMLVRISSWREQLSKVCVQWVLSRTSSNMNQLCPIAPNHRYIQFPVTLSSKPFILLPRTTKPTTKNTTTYKHHPPS